MYIILILSKVLTNKVTKHVDKIINNNLNKIAI